MSVILCHVPIISQVRDMFKFITITLASIALAADPLCPAPEITDGYDWVYADTETGVWYTKTEDFVSWEDCPTECENINGKWAKTLTQDEVNGAVSANWWNDPENATGENIFISGLLIGSGSSKAWYWADGTRIENFFWRRGQPDQRSEDQNCMYMAGKTSPKFRGSGWGDLICHRYTQRCMCEFRC